MTSDDDTGNGTYFSQWLLGACQDSEGQGAVTINVTNGLQVQVLCGV